MLMLQYKFLFLILNSHSLNRTLKTHFRRSNVSQLNLLCTHARPTAATKGRKGGEQHKRQKKETKEDPKERSSRGEQSKVNE